MDFLESFEANYIIGYLSGSLFGILENFFVYGFFTGFRSATPLMHGLGTGIIGIGYYFIITDSKLGALNLILPI